MTRPPRRKIQALWSSHYKSHYGQHMRRPLRQRYNPSSVVGNNPQCYCITPGSETLFTYTAFSHPIFDDLMIIHLMFPLIGNNIITNMESRFPAICNKVGCDGTSVNTGVKGGIIRNMELILNRPLQWLVCQLHANELPLRHLFPHVDITTTEPRNLTGEIRKSLVGCEKLPVVSSRPIENTLCEVTNKKDLSTYQLYLIEICEVINC
ncbi:hypothetical protein AVEN_197109-1 [Araneus ventricosus]|uniref:Uncharacterized protein n=1 Tax=Araneus ventricosus TaxID=182803 RepID=A0A4Y2UA98_ARAVE|nr:hypothetical protein AVEN_197109-1 [Araneus ventricosus]